jgi:diguanylate cyclase (GGDEF)-like protein
MNSSQNPNGNKISYFLRRESIGSKVLLSMTALLLVLGGLFIGVSLLILQQRFDAFDTEQYQEDLSRVALVIEKDRDAFTAFLVDYSSFDDTYAFIQTRDSSYVQSNFTFESMTTLGINAALLLDLTGEVIVGLNRAPDNRLTPIDIKLQHQLLSGINLETAKNSQNALVDLLWINEKPFLRGVSAINNSTRNAIPNGFMIFAKELNDTFLDQIRELTSVKFSLAQTQDDALDSAKLDKGLWRLTKKLPKMNTQIIVEGETKLKSQRRVSFTLLISNTILIVLLTLLGIYKILSQRILQRITEFSLLADKRRTGTNGHMRWTVRGADELDNLAFSLNEMLDEIQSRHDELEHLSNHDPLTAIGNRRLLKTRIAELQESSLSALPSYLLSFGVDGFNLVNDGMGHHAGDLVLRVIAERISTLSQRDDTNVRLGGDEFAILMRREKLENVMEVANNLLLSLAHPISVEGKNLVISISIGIAFVNQNLSVNEVIRNADLAMQEAKRLGKGRCSVFNEGLLNQASRRNHLEQALRLALTHHAIEVWFQPIITPENGAVVSMEALARWKHEGDFIAPDEFIEIAENCGLITQLGNIILNLSCAALAMLRKDYPSLSCSVNVSALQFEQGNLIDDINLALRTHNLPASALHLELTESAVAHYEINIAPKMYALVGQGVHFHLDDFGTGYSSLDRLQNLPFDTLKIDRSFVIPLRIGNDIMARNIIRMGQDLGMNVIGEGIETKEELDCLLQLGCKQIQGYYFARPMPLESLRVWLEQH